MVKNRKQDREIRQKKRDIQKRKKELHRRRLDRSNHHSTAGNENSNRQQPIEDNEGINEQDNDLLENEPDSIDENDNNMGVTNPAEDTDTNSGIAPEDELLAEELRQTLSEEKNLNKEIKNRKRERKREKRRETFRKNKRRLAVAYATGGWSFFFTLLFIIGSSILMFLFTVVINPVFIMILTFGAFVVITSDEEEQSTEQVAQVEEDTDSGSSTGVISVDGKVWPVPHTKNLTSDFSSARANPVSGIVKAHNGIDIAGPGGSPANLDKDIVSFLDGEVVRADTPTKSGGYGNLVVIEHDGGLSTYYAHLNRISVSVGAKVKAGDKVGGMGTTGNSTGVHLHFEIRENGTPVHPINYLGGFETTGVPMKK